MRRIYAAAWIMILILIASLVSHALVQSVTQTLNEHLTQVSVAAQEQDFVKANREIDETLAYFSKAKHWLELFLKRESVAAVATNLYGLHAYAVPDCVQDLYNEVDKLRQQIEMLRHLFFSIF